MGKTFSCTFEDCDQVFPREFQLKKHKASHDDPGSLHHCPYCEFFTLDPRNLEVHIAKHTGEKNYACPDTIKVSELSGSVVEERCKYRTNDRSLLTKHRRKVHKYVPRRRASPQRDAAITFIPYTVPSSAATENTTSDVTNLKPRRTKKRNATSTKRSKSSRTHVAGEADNSTNVKHEELDSLFPAILQEGVDEHGRMARVESPDATGSSSIGSSSAVSLIPNEHALLGVYGQQAYVGSPDATSTLSAGSGDATSVDPNEGISLDTHGQSFDVSTSHAGGSSSSHTLVAPNQDISAGGLFNPPTDYDWSWLYTDGFAGSSTSNFRTDTYATGGFQTITGHDRPGITAWDASTWDYFWGGYNSHTYI
ncbi:hypothetical protein J3R82DRAFT_2010 [Butyriboletus roseoflavus]|nr:hypothetical protein J3R82DRAFT_2010 [Butyriboletus roseoflavus]